MSGVPVSECELVLARCPAEVGSKVHTGLEGWVAHNGRTSALCTELHCEADPIGDENGQLVCEPAVCEGFGLLCVGCECVRDAL